jgi:hypothetical protein
MAGDAQKKIHENSVGPKSYNSLIYFVGETMIGCLGNIIKCRITPQIEDQNNAAYTKY